MIVPKDSLNNDINWTILIESLWDKFVSWYAGSASPTY